jgi:hypothetical protein
LDLRSSSALTTDFGHPSRQFRRPADQYLGLVETIAGALQRTTFTGLIYDAGIQRLGQRPRNRRKEKRTRAAGPFHHDRTVDCRVPASVLNPYRYW